MSIKFVHLAFMTICTLFCLAVGIWGLAKDAGLLAIGLIFITSGLALFGYTIHFFRKWRNKGFFL